MKEFVVCILRFLSWFYFLFFTGNFVLIFINNVVIRFEVDCQQIELNMYAMGKHDFTVLTSFPGSIYCQLSIIIKYM